MINYIPRTEDWCGYCRIMIPCITGQQPDEISTKNDIERVRGFLGDPGTRPQQIWNRIRDCDGSEGDWGWDISPTRQEWITEQPREWRLLDEDIEYPSTQVARGPLSRGSQMEAFSLMGAIFLGPPDALPRWGQVSVLSGAKEDSEQRTGRVGSPGRKSCSR